MKLSSYIRFVSFLASSNLFISAAALASAAGVFAYFGSRVDRGLVFFIFFATLFTYNFQRRVGNVYSSISFSKAERFLMISGLVGMGFHITSLEFIDLFILGISGVLSIGYAYPFISFKERKLSLRQVPHLKIWIIVVVWILSCSLIPALKVHRDNEILPVYLLVFQQAFFVMALTIPFDIRDLKWDSPKLKTLPQRFGVGRSRFIALILITISALASFVLHLLQFTEFTMFLAHLGTAAISALLISRSQPYRHEIFFSIGIDGMLLLQGILFLIF